MPHKRRSRTNNGYKSSQQTNQTQRSASCSLDDLICHNLPPKKVKKHLSPGRIVSLHNLLPAVNDADISALIHHVNITSYKRALNWDTGEPSEVAFLLLCSVQDAMRVFMQLDGTQLMGQVVRVNFVNGIHFEGQTVEEAAPKATDYNATSSDLADKHDCGAEGTKGITHTSIVKMILPPRYVEKPKAKSWFGRLFSWRK